MIRIAVRLPNWVGDTVMATPTLAVLRRAYPRAQITALARPNSRAVLENNSDIDNLWLIEDRGAGNLLRLARRIHRERFDLSVLLPNSFRSALAFALAGVKKRIGYGMDGRSILLTDPVETSIFHAQCHQVEYYINVLADLEFCNIEEAERRLQLTPSDEARSEIDALLKSRGLGRNQFLAAISPGAAFGSSKCWAPERYAQIADLLREKYDASVVLLGAPNEAPLCREIAELCQGPVQDLGPDVSLSGLIALCERLGMMITNDCGAMHVATAMKTPLVAIFGPTDPRRSRPFDTQASVVEDIKGCGCDIAPCYKKICPIEHQCMTAVTVADVSQAIEHQVQRLRSRHER